MKMDIAKTFNTVGKTIVKHSPEILTGVSIAGTISAVVLAVKATPEAEQRIKIEKRRRKAEGITKKMTPVDYVRTCWRPYVPAALACTASIACNVSSLKISAGRITALATAYELSQNTIDKYKESVKDTIGEKKEKEILDKMAQKFVDETPVDTDKIIETGNGNTLCYDIPSGRYFWSDKQKIESAINAFNSRLVYEDYLSLNELYYELGLPQGGLYEDVGWNHGVHGLVEVHYSSTIAKTGSNHEGTPCLTLDFNVYPKHDYSSFH